MGLVYVKGVQIQGGIMLMQMSFDMIQYVLSFFSVLDNIEATPEVPTF